MPAQPETLAGRPEQQPRPEPPGTPGRDEQVPPPTDGRPTRSRKPPGWTRDYQMNEMSEFRRPAPSMLDQVGVGGMLNYDDLDKESGLTREAAAPPGETCGNLETGLPNPDQSSSRETTSTWVGGIIIGMKELCRDSGVDEIVTAELVGQMATDLSAKSRGDFPI